MTAPTLAPTGGDVHMDVIAQWETEFAKQCQFLEEVSNPLTQCPATANWLVWILHSQVKCPQDVYLCEKHKDYAENYWINQLKRVEAHGGGTCKNCGGRFNKEAQLSDMFRAIKL